jgi:uncharacterized protein YcbK (DUF882 family)
LRNARRRIFSGSGSGRVAAASFAAFLCGFFAATSTETAVANGDTRTISLFHSHTGESIQATFRVNGSFDPAVLAKLNYFLRDWRNNDVAHMDPRLFDVVWEAYRTAGEMQPIVVVSAYRSPETNAMLRARSHAVAEHSQHILGKAMDTRGPDMSMEQIREIGMRMQRGGVGYYGRENFVHLDVGNVRHWPRMSYDQIARLFPDGKTVHLAADGRTQPRYQEALAEISARGGIVTDVAQAQGGGGFFGWLFGRHDQDEDAVAARETAPARTQVAAASVTAAAPPAPARMTAAERRAARAAAKAAPALAAIDASNRTDSPPAANPARSLFAALTPPAPPAIVPPPAATGTPAPGPAAFPVAAARDSRAGSAPDAGGAVLDPAKDARKEQERIEKDKTGKALFAGLAPIPPARPADLVVIGSADVPTPPGRPKNLIQLASLAPQDGAGAMGKDAAKSDPAGPLARAANLPVVITRGPNNQPALPSAALGYAENAAPAAAQKRRAAAQSAAPDAAMTPARLDRSNYSELTSATPTAEAPPASILGQAFTGLRQAARAVPDALAAMPSAGYKIAFGAAANLLDCAHFAKAPVTVDKTPAGDKPASPDGVSISDARPAPAN